MTIAIAWQNPTPVHASKRCIKFGKDTSSDMYLVQELIAGADEEQWANMSVLEVVCSRHVQSPSVPHHASNRSWQPEPRVTIRQQAE
jgi:hypothetical protein